MKNNLKSNSETITNTSSNIISNNGDINIISNNKDITQKGSLVYTDNGDISYNAKNDINIIASKDIYNQSTKSKNISESISIGNNAIQVGFNSGKNTSSTNSITNNNSIINTNNGNITLITNDNDINIKGANIESANDIIMNVANNLNIESLQDTYYNKSNSNNFGFNIGAGSGSANIGFNIANTKGTTDSQWVNNQTSIIGNNKVDIKVGTKENSEGNTNIIGAIIASGKYKEVELPESEWKVDINTGETIKTKIVFKDNGNLNLTTNTLTYSDINDFYKQNTKGHNFNTSIGSDKTDNKQLNLHPQGSTTIGLINQSEEKEQITRATVGGGSILVKNKINGKDILINENNKSNQNTLLSDLNRDINKSQEITKDKITGSLEGSMTIDNRLFTEGGRGSIYDDVVNAPMNAWNATKGALKDTKLALDTTSDVLGAIPLSPVWVSRKLTEMTGIPPHPFPSFGIGDEVMGRASIVRDVNNKPVLNKGYLNQYTQKDDAGSFGSDTNPLFRLLYNILPGGKAATDQHDVLMAKRDNNIKNGDKNAKGVSNFELAATILPSFAATYYGIIGTILDTKNYSSNASKIKESYDNKVPKNSVIVDKKGNFIRSTWKK